MCNFLFLSVTPLCGVQAKSKAGVCVCVYLMCVSTYVCVSKYVCVCVCVSSYVCVCVYVYLCVCTCL